MKKITILSLAILSGLSLSTLAEARGMPGGERPAFGDVDANADGEVTPAELQAYGETRKTARFDEMDANGDGALSAAELDTAHEARAASRSSRIVERLDTDGDGLVSREEMEARADHHGGRGHGRGGDRAERSEGRGMGERGFSRADADGNGTLSAEEWDTMGQRRARN